jgi:hypothetical protein
MSDTDKGSFEKAGSAMGGMAGRMGDAAVGVMGSMISTAAGLLGGWWSDRTPDEVTKNFNEQAESSCRTHFENSARNNKSYDSVRPLYQFGHLAGGNPDYQGRSFEEVEPELKTAWAGEPATTYGSWDDVQEYIKTGFVTRHSRGGNLP